MCIRVFHKLDDISNKNAFQWDAYRPLFTVRGVSVLGSIYPGGGVVSVQAGSLSRVVSVQGGSLSGRPLGGQTDACENITWPQTSFAGGNNAKNWHQRLYYMKTKIPVTKCYPQ